MATRDMTNLVSKHATDFIGAISAAQKARVNKDIHAASDKGVDLIIPDQYQPNIARCYARCLKQWRRVAADDIFDLRVPDYRRPGAELGWLKRHPKHNGG